MYVLYMAYLAYGMPPTLSNTHITDGGRWTIPFLCRAHRTVTHRAVTLATLA